MKGTGGKTAGLTPRPTRPALPPPDDGRRMWRFLSILAREDISLGMAGRIAGSLGISRADLVDLTLRGRSPSPGAR